MSNPTPAPAAAAATHPTFQSPPSSSPSMSPVARIVQDANNHFTEWITFYDYKVQGAVLIHSVAIGHLTIDDGNRVRDLLECHGWRTSLRVSEGETHLSLERTAAPISDGTAEFEAAILAMQPSEEDEPATTNVCGICNVADAVRPRYLDTCGHVFCADCIADDCTSDEKAGSSTCPVCAKPYRFRDVLRL